MKAIKITPPNGNGAGRKLLKKRTNAGCWREAQQVLVGGVNSPVRSFRAVGASPFFVERGSGPILVDVEGRSYVDYVGSWGAALLGHAHPDVLAAVREALKNGTGFGTPTPAETDLAKAIRLAIPSMEQVRFVTSGTEAVMSAVRLARAATGRRKIIKFDGAYHGHSDGLLAKAGSGLATLGIPASAGVPAEFTGHTITVSFNDRPAVERAVKAIGSDLAAILVEPVMANIGVIPPEDGFLNFLKSTVRKVKALLIFDEVITGFRLAGGGAQALYKVTPDITVLGKVIGGGFPIGAYGGPKSLMRNVAPEGSVYQAGTLAGQPVTMAAGLATLEILRSSPNIYQQLEDYGKRLRDGLIYTCWEERIPVEIHQVGSLLTVFFSKDPIRNAEDARRADTVRFAKYFRGMLRKGIYLPPSAFEAWFVSAQHGESHLRQTLHAHSDVIRQL
ncbi:MAG: glutamate-1-semialdehyde 2,1-aminomutase [Candidatus Omnitrophica bacterium]|nr:glutamate-1-semialdehyde 2,1-aminomutase [Candidatus Omnitrophota bacterium]